MDFKDLTRCKIDDLLCRFIVNLPSFELEDSNRLMFHLERMWWFYLDHYHCHSSQQPQFFAGHHVPSFKAFCKITCAHLKIPGMEQWVEESVDEFENYKAEIPVCGGAIFRHKGNDMELLMIQPVGSSSWTVPKGKLNYGESLWECAQREISEEIHLDLSQMEMQAEPWTIRTKSAHNTTIFPIFLSPTGIKPADPIFKIDKKEVSDIKWITVSMLIDSQQTKNNNLILTELAHKIVAQINKLLERK